jgi:REP element-mobilizing transposase RayT
MQIFLDEGDYKHFAFLLGDVTEEFRIECWNYCLMPNHYHATLRPTRPNLSEAIRRLNSIYAQWWNRRHDRVGHVFQGRFKDQIVQREGYLPALCRYIALNPVRARLTTRPEDWPWSSYAATVGLCSAPPFLAASAVLKQFGEDEERILQARFVGYVLSVDERDYTADRVRSNERVLGDCTFKRIVQAELPGIPEMDEPAPIILTGGGAIT